MSVCHLIAVADTALLGRVGLTEPAAAHVSVAVGAIGIGSGRLVPTVAAVMGLIGVVIGGLALARSTGRIGTGIGNGRRGAIAAGLAGLIGVAVGGLHLATSTGGFGTGNGRAGAIVAMTVGLIGMVLAGLALARARRTGRQTRGLGVTR